MQGRWGGDSMSPTEVWGRQVRSGLVASKLSGHGVYTIE
jgi:hypothetical protein